MVDEHILYYVMQNISIQRIVINVVLEIIISRNSRLSTFIMRKNKQCLLHFSCQQLTTFYIIITYNQWKFNHNNEDHVKCLPQFTKIIIFIN